MQNVPAIQPEQTPRLLFIVGMWRSGTSLVHALLNRHPQVALMYEAEPLELWPRGTGSLWTKGWTQRLEFFNQTFSRHDLQQEPFTSTPAGREGALALYREYARKRGAIIMGEKAPSYYKRLPRLARLFPEARFLIIWRDPLDCCRSAVRAARENRFFAQRGMTQRMLLGAEILGKGVECLLRDKRTVCEVVYNEVVENPECELRRVCEFLEIPFAPSMLDLKSADVSNVPSGEHHAGVRSGVIGKTAQANEILPPPFVAKGKRYAKLWHERFSQLGFARALVVSSDINAPGRAEAVADRCVWMCWRGVDGSKQFLFRHMPLSCWRWMRSATPRGDSKARN